MTRARRVFAAIVGAAFVMAGATPQAGPSFSSTGPQAGEAPVLQFFRNPLAVPAFAAVTIDGKTLSPAVPPGKVTIVNFWATWCGPCQAEIPDLVELQKKYAAHLRIVGISEDEAHDLDIVKRYVRARRVNYPVVMATPDLRGRFPEVPGLPTTFLVDRYGRLVKKHVGLLDARLIEQETRALAGLPSTARIELIDRGGR